MYDGWIHFSTVGYADDNSNNNDNNSDICVW